MLGFIENILLIFRFPAFFTSPEQIYADTGAVKTRLPTIYHLPFTIYNYYNLHLHKISESYVIISNRHNGL
jgi:hypothetical protein